MRIRFHVLVVSRKSGSIIPIYSPYDITRTPDFNKPPPLNRDYNRDPKKGEGT